MADTTGQDKKSVEDMNNALQQQLVIMGQLRDAITSMTQDLSKYCELSSKCFSGVDWKTVTKEVEKNNKQTKTTSQSTQDLTKNVSKLSQTMSKLAPVIGGVTGALNGLKQGFSNLFAVGKGIFNLFGSVAKSVFKVGSAIAAAPFKMLKGLQEEALAGQAAADQLFEAMENLRKEFGAIGPTAGTVKSVASSMQGFSATGLSAYGVFGNLAERIKYMTELASQMGPQFAANAEEFKKNGGALLAYQKGLGLTGEQMAAVAISGKKMGKDMGTVLNGMTKQALHMSKAFGLDAKVISKDMGKAMSDVAHFGHLSTKEIGAAVVYANKLGVSIDKLTGLMDQFDTFDKAADSTSKLNEQFGTNIDAMELMAAQSPAEKMEILRKSFLATGKDMNQLNYQQRKLIQQTTGLDQATFDAAMASADQGDLLSDVNKESKKAEDKTLSQADALKEVAVQIERLNNGLKAGPGGFFGNLAAGFSRGVKSSAEFQGVMNNLRQSMRITGGTGVQLGQMFVKAFPGVKQMLGALSDLFNPQRFMKLSGDVMKVFKKFFDPKSGEFKGNFEDLLEELKKVFFDFFDSGKPASNKFFEGFKKFGEMLGKIFSGLVKFIVPKLADAVNSVAEWIRKPKIPKVGASKEWFAPFTEAFDVIKKQLGPALKNLGSAIWEKLKEGLLGTKVGKGIIAGAVAMVLGPALISGIAGAGAGGGIKAALGGLMGAKGGGAAGAAAGAADQASAAGTAAAAGQQLTSSPASMVATAIPPKEDIEKMKAAAEAGISWMDLTKFLVGMAGLFFIGLKAFSAALPIVKGMPVEDILKAGLMLTEIAGVVFIVTKIAPGLAEVGKAPMSEILKGLLAVGITVAAMIIAALAIGGVANLVGISALEAGGKVMLQMAIVFAIAAGVVIAAAGIGAAILASAGLGAAAIVAGMAAIGLAVAAMAAAAIIVAEKLGQIKEDPAALKAKAEAFGVIMNSIANMMEKVQGIIEAMDFGFFESGDSINERVKLMTKFIQTLIDGDPSGSGGISGIITKIINGLKTIKPDQIEVAKAFASVLQAVGGMMGAVAQTIESINADEATHWWSSAEENGKAMKDAMSGATDLLATMLPGIQNLVVTLIGAVRMLPRDKAFAEGATAFGSILGAVGNLMKAMAPNVKDFTDTVKVEGGIFTAAYTETKVNSTAIAAAAGYMTKMLETMKTHLPPLLTAMMSGIGGELKKLKKNELDALPSVAKIVESAVALITALSNTNKGDVKIDKIDTGIAGQAEILIRTQAPDLVGMLNQIKTSMPDFIKGMIEIAKIIPKDANFKTQIEGMVSMFNALKGMLDAIKTAGEMPKVDGQSAMDALKNALWNVIEFLFILAPPAGQRSWWNGSKIDLQNIISYLNELGVKMTALKSADGPKKLADLFSNLSTLFKAINNPFDGISPEEGQTITGAIKDILWNQIEVLSFLANDPKAKISNFVEKANQISSDAKGLSANPSSVSKVFNTAKSILDEISNLSSYLPAEMKEGESAADLYLKPYRFVSEVFQKMITPATGGFGNMNIFASIVAVVKAIKAAGYDPKEATKLDKTVKETDAFLNTYLVSMDALLRKQDKISATNSKLPQFNKSFTELSFSGYKLSESVVQLVNASKALEASTKSARKLNPESVASDVSKINEFWAAAGVALPDLSRAFTEVDKGLNDALAASTAGSLQAKLKSLEAILELPQKLKAFGEGAEPIKIALKSVAESIAGKAIKKLGDSKTEITIKVEVALDPKSVYSGMFGREATASATIDVLSDLRSALAEVKSSK